MCVCVYVWGGGRGGRARTRLDVCPGCMSGARHVPETFQRKYEREN